MKDVTIEGYELDEAIENGTATQLIGRKAYNGVYIRGTIVQLKNGKIAIKVRRRCKCQRRIFTLYLVSGLHKGAFCYTADVTGNMERFNLRDHVLDCGRSGCVE